MLLGKTSGVVLSQRPVLPGVIFTVISESVQKGLPKIAPKPEAVSLQSLKCLFSTKAVCPPVGGLYNNGKSVSDNCFMGDL